MIIDSHAHLTADGVYENITPILKRAQQAGVTHIFNICTDLITLERGIKLRKEFPWIYNVGATTPHDVENEGEPFFSRFEGAAKNGDLVAIGETGLDYFYENSNRSLQRTFLEQYLHLASEANLPVVIHCRDAFDDLFAVADSHFKKESLVLHCFTGTQDEAKRVLDRGWTISFSGIVTFKKSESLQEVAKMTPLERMIVETDTPYLAPQSKRGKQNEPAFVIETAQCLSRLKEIPFEKFAQAVCENTLQFFRVNP
jgi:TatD DNase family protein